MVLPGSPVTGGDKLPSGTSKCYICTKTVYPTEKFQDGEHVFHKACFRCAVCKQALGIGGFAVLAGVYYCKAHYTQKFKEKGNYDEGFGLQQHKKQWKAEVFGVTPQTDFSKSE
jgi:hypothetical protein